MKRLLVQQPDFRHNGKLQFIVGYTGGGANACVHLTRHQYASRLRKKAGNGKLVEIDGKFYWEVICHSHNDGECHWKFCPQLRDKEPAKTGRHCPYDSAEDHEA